MINLKEANVLITGGSNGIGLGLAKRFLAAGSTVMITGRNSEKLEKAASDYPGLLTFANDVSIPQERETLAKHVKNIMPGLNILINNAGIQRRVSLAADTTEWNERQAEIDTLLSAPIHLSHLLIPTLLNHGTPVLIVNVTSGGAYIPQAFAPIYSACKAALHSYTITLRHALANTNCRVKELVPPAVQTGLAGAGLSHGASLNEFCDHVFPQFMDDSAETIGFGPTANLLPQLSGTSIDQLFKTSASRFSIETY